MRSKILFIAVCLAAALFGCSDITGTYYLRNEKYDQGIKAFEKAQHDNPNDPAVNYYLGRFYLAQEKGQQALPYLRRAVRLEPDRANYYFWLGVAYWTVTDFEGERKSYLRGLELDKDYLPARLYLGHNLLDNGEWKGALSQYDEVLKRDPYNPEALYNKGLALQHLNRPAQEIQAWKTYLNYYPDGKWALRAVEHLNSLGGFSYRNFTIGYRTVPLRGITFAPESFRLLSVSLPSLEVIGSILKVNKEIELKIVGYKQGDPALALARAKEVREYLLNHFPAVSPSRLHYEGKGQSEKVKTSAKVYSLKESISFVTTEK
jgi:tetratricopeptide (TPR) repeat protein